MNDMKFIKNKVKKFIGTTALMLIAGAANATLIGSGNLVINLDQDAFTSFGVPSGVNSVVVHYFDQTAGNSATGPQLFTEQIEHSDLSGDYSNLIFEINNFNSRLGPVIGGSHQLQGTNFEFSPSAPPTGQVGFGGVLRLGFPFAEIAPNVGFGGIAIGDFTLTFADRSEAEQSTSGFLFTTTTGFSDGSYLPLWDTTDIIVLNEEDTLIISGNLKWSPEILGLLGDFGGSISKDAGTFTFTAETFEKTPKWISNQVVALKAASWSQVSDRPVRISANAPLSQAIHYINIAGANYRQNKFSIGNRYLKIAVSSINKFKTILERGTSKGKFPEEEVQSLLETADSIIAEIYYLMDNPS